MSILCVSAHKQDKKCSRELEGIVYTPKICAFEYMKKITETLVVQGPQLFVPETAKPIFEKFASTFGVAVYVVDAFGVWYEYPGSNQLVSQLGIHLLDRAYALGEAFSNLVNVGKPFQSGVYSYAKVVWNFDGQMYTIVVMADKTRQNSLTASGCC